MRGRQLPSNASSPSSKKPFKFLTTSTMKIFIRCRRHTRRGKARAETNRKDPLVGVVGLGANMPISQATRTASIRQTLSVYISLYIKLSLLFLTYLAVVLARRSHARCRGNKLVHICCLLVHSIDIMLCSCRKEPLPWVSPKQRKPGRGSQGSEGASTRLASTGSFGYFQATAQTSPLL